AMISRYLQCPQSETGTATKFRAVRYSVLGGNAWVSRSKISVRLFASTASTSRVRFFSSDATAASGTPGGLGLVTSTAIWGAVLTLLSAPATTGLRLVSSVAVLRAALT